MPAHAASDSASDQEEFEMPLHLPQDTPPPKEITKLPSSATPDEFWITVKKVEGHMKIGLDTVARSSPTLGCALRVQRVKEGLVLDWNEQHADRQVREGDHICEVNGESTDTERMYGVIASNAELNMLIKREWPAPRRS